MISYKITVFLTNTYEINKSFIYKTSNNLIDHKGEGRMELAKEVNNRFDNWYSYDINKII